LPKPRQNEVIYVKGWEMSDESVQNLVVDQNVTSVGSAASSVQPHAIVTLTKSQLLAAKPDHDGLLASVAPAFEVRVSAVTVDRAMVVLEALIARWESRGGSVHVNEVADTAAPRSALAIGPDFFGVRLAEHVDESKPISDSTRLTGRLALFVTGDENHDFRRRWWDTKSQRLERMILPFVETLANALAAKRQERLDAECVARQQKKSEAIRKASNRDSSREFYSRQELMQNVRRWVDARDLRGYLSALKAAAEAGEWHPRDGDQFAKWFEWATRFADSIDPIIAGQLPEGKPQQPQNTSVADLDLTAATRRVIGKLGCSDTTEMWKQTQDTVREACDGKFGPIWNEITRVLEGLAYDVSKRENASDWW
jgi:hypothetical protein